VHVSFI